MRIIAWKPAPIKGRIGRLVKIASCGKINQRLQRWREIKFKNARFRGGNRVLGVQKEWGRPKHTEDLTDGAKGGKHPMGLMVMACKWGPNVVRTVKKAQKAQKWWRKPTNWTRRDTKRTWALRPANMDHGMGFWSCEVQVWRRKEASSSSTSFGLTQQELRA